jgi:hypothetical protein
VKALKIFSIKKRILADYLTDYIYHIYSDLGSKSKILGIIASDCACIVTVALTLDAKSRQQESDRNDHLPLGRRPDEHPGLSDLGLSDLGLSDLGL